MGVAPSTIEDDKVLALCLERKRFVREARDGRCALAASHCAYIFSLRETGSLLRDCFEPEVLKESIPNVSTSLLRVNHMNAGRNTMTGIEELSAPAVVTSRTSFPDVREAHQDFENADGTRCLREEKGIPKLEQEGQNSPANEEGNFAQSEDGFDNPSTETLVRVFKKDVPVENTHSPSHCSLESKESFPNVSNVVKDVNSCMKEVEILFFRACESGKEVSRVLEEDKVQFRPLLPEEITHESKPSGFLATFFACCWEDVTILESPPLAEIKYLTWHKSVSPQLSPSRDRPGTNTGSHISTLDRLYAWESKLYEVKASSTVCRKYDEKCKKLRHQESRGEYQINIDLTRAAVKDLHSRILVAVQKIDFISKNIEDLRDRDLQPQLEELIGSLIRMWATMLSAIGTNMR